MTCRKPFCWCRLECQQRTSFIDIVYYSIIVFFFFSFFFIFDKKKTNIYNIAIRLRETSSLSRLLFRVLPSLCVYRAFFDNQTNERSIRNRRQKKKKKKRKDRASRKHECAGKRCFSVVVVVVVLLAFANPNFNTGGFLFFLSFFFFFLLLSSALSGVFERKHRNMSLGEIPTSA